jgi:hypothetical protein
MFLDLERIFFNGQDCQDEHEHRLNQEGFHMVVGDRVVM